MDKPAILKIKETEQKILEAINSSKLPAFLLSPVIEKIYKELTLLEAEEYEKAKTEYEATIKEANKEKNE